MLFSWTLQLPLPLIARSVFVLVKDLLEIQTCPTISTVQTSITAAQYDRTGCSLHGALILIQIPASMLEAGYAHASLSNWFLLESWEGSWNLKYNNSQHKFKEGMDGFTRGKYSQVLMRWNRWKSSGEPGACLSTSPTPFPQAPTPMKNSKRYCCTVSSNFRRQASLTPNIQLQTQSMGTGMTPREHRGKRVSQQDGAGFSVLLTAPSCFFAGGEIQLLKMGEWAILFFLHCSGLHGDLWIQLLKGSEKRL